MKRLRNCPCTVYKGRTVGERIRDFALLGVDPEFVDVPAAYDTKKDLEQFNVDPYCDFDSSRESLVAPNGDQIDSALKRRNPSTDEQSSESSN